MIGSGQAPAGSSTDTESFAAAFTVHAGADGQQSLTYGLSITNATTNLVDSVTNSTVLLKQVSATEVDGYVTIGGVDTTVFKLTVNGTGSVTMEIDRGVKGGLGRREHRQQRGHDAWRQPGGADGDGDRQ
ncbi:DUF5801 domain-containing protein (plasmid) [Bradyrhizobium sp. ISRA435]|nr:DUF5801 domain-containing protein [Bradyrhizobium sp. ISRA435]